ncbi:MAG: PD40 domain-containing protein [Acidobacteria bacterium]|nr:PD40 domain-containing protein [Acidobacteriota bacterium]
MLEAARQKEVVEGDLKAAVEQYRKIAAQFAKQPAVAAQALVKMGQCQEKLGQAEARKSYERVVKEYAGAGEYAAQARARLAALAGPRPVPGEMSLRALDSGPQFESSGGMSSDGRLIAFTDYYRGGSPSVYETATKRTRRVVNLEWDQPKTGFGAQVAISRDGKWVAFLWYTTVPGYAELRLVGTDGTGMRTVVRGQGWGAPLDWSPDGRFVLTSRWKGDQSKGETEAELTLVAVADGSIRTVKKFQREPSNARISPDGRWIAYRASDGVAHVMATDGTMDRQLFSNDPKAHLVDWTPDGRALVFLSDRSGTRGLWSVEMEGGMAAGEARILRSGMASEIFPVGIGADGRLLFVENSGLNNSYVVALAGGAPARLTRRFEGANGFAAYSPDGKRLAWFGLKEQFSVRGGTLVVQDRASGSEKTLPAPGGVVMNFAPQWFDDNRSLVFQVTESNKDTLVKLDVETGHTSKILDARQMMWSLLSADGKTHYFAKREEGHILALDLTTGTERKIADVTPRRLVRALALSPDGKTLAFVVVHPPHLPDPTGFVGWSLELCDLATGKVSIFKRGDNQNRLVGFYRRTLQFTPDGKALVATTGATKPVRIRLLPLDGGPDRILVQSTGLLFDASISPDGKSLVYTESTTKNDLWVLENFLAKTSAR